MRPATRRGETGRKWDQQEVRQAESGTGKSETGREWDRQKAGPAGGGTTQEEIISRNIVSIQA